MPDRRIAVSDGAIVEQLSDDADQVDDEHGLRFAVAGPRINS
jgi:hypothetical protein